MRDAVRRWAMGVFKKGMDLYHGHSGAVVDTEAGQALIMRAAKAGLRSARAFCHYDWAQDRVCGEEEEAEVVYAKAVALLEAEIAGSASETEASGGPCVHATNMWGHCYYFGRGVERDEARALELYHHAVEVDKNQDAMFQLAFAYRQGYFGQARDYERALSLYKRGAELGDYECRYSLGRIYRYGVCGVEVDLKQALYWMEKANEQRGGKLLTREIEEIREMMITNSIQD
jgi:tetratricopeptide (TPR) repeat protein